MVQDVKINEKAGRGSMSPTRRAMPAFNKTFKIPD